MSKDRMELFSSLEWIKKELFNQNEFLHSVLRNQKQLEDTLLQLLKEYKEIRELESKFRQKKD